MGSLFPGALVIGFGGHGVTGLVKRFSGRRALLWTMNSLEIAEGQTTGVEFWLYGFDARGAEDGFRDLFGVLHDRTALEWKTVG